MPPGSPPAKRKRTQPTLFGSRGQGSNAAGPSNARQDDDLARALALSQREAELAGMGDDEQLKAALAASLADAQKEDAKLEDAESRQADAAAAAPTASKPPRKRNADGEDKDEALKHDSSNASFSSLTDPSIPPSFDADAFDTRNETLINRLEGSLDLVYCKSWLRPHTRAQLRRWMLTQLAWHRVTYVRPRTTMRIVTPRYTTTFGKDDTGAPDSAYKVLPKPFPPVLRALCDEIEKKTGAHFNAMIINFYANGKDSISYHADDEAFLGKLPTIASISLGAARDFYLRRKAPASQVVPDALPSQKMGTKGAGPAATRPTEKFRLEDGDLLVMRGRTQADWEHSIPKRTSHVGGRINITFRRVVNVSGTNNFLRYNRLGDSKAGDIFRWNPKTQQMEPGSGGV